MKGNTMRAYLLLFAAAAACAQNGSLNAPLAGYVFDNGAHAMRPVMGIPGAATIGAPLDWGDTLNAAYAAPKSDSFIGVASDGSTHLFANSSGTIGEVSLPGLMASPARVAFSPQGTALVLYASGQAQIVTGLPGSPALAATVTLKTPAADGQRHIAPALAVSDDGQLVLAAGSGLVQLAAANGAVSPVMQAQTGAAVAFAPGSHDAAIAARGTGALLIRDVAGSAIQQSLASDGQAFNAIAGIGFSADGSTVYLASASAKSIAVFDLTGGRTDLTCSCTPAELTPMGAAFRLTELSADPLWLLDTSVAGPRIVFVPALRAAQ